ncbi:DNA topoisomerase I [Methanosarcinales archaeon]|nr:MAG: DNA topoisomerase I [Methanosarcinales archaeon]
MDLTWGATLTRFLSLSAGRVGKSFLSVGRVQSPTLALLVGREKEIQSFKPKKYFEVEVELENGVVARHEHGRFETYEEAQKILNSLDSVAKLLDLKSIVKKERPPIPFNTTEFLRAATSIGFSASSAMSIAENLYTNGYISYPRTDNTVYPASLNLKSVLKFLSKTEFREYVKQLLGDTLKPTRGKKETTDHPPIYPSSPASREELSGKEWKIYELVVRRFLATLYPPCVVECKQAIFESGGEVLKAYGTTLIDIGWRAVYTYSKISENPLPNMGVGDEFTILSSKIVEGETKPPPRFTQGSLIKLMEKLGIGTKSTRHEIIGKLYERAYVHGNPIKPTKLSFSVIETLEKYAPSITKPDMTRRLEEDMEKISRGDAIPDEVLDESRGMLSEVLKTLSMEREGISEHLRNGVMEDSVVGICRECGSKLVIRKSKKGGRFIGCTGYPECTFSLPLPRSGRIYVLDKVCEKHGIHHLRIYTKGRKPWDLGCPECGYEKWKSENC